MNTKSWANFAYHHIKKKLEWYNFLGNDNNIIKILATDF